MPVTRIDPRSALVVIDLQRGILAMPTQVLGDEIVRRAALLADAFHARGLPVIYIHLVNAADGSDAPPGRVDRAAPMGARAADFSDFDPRLPRAEGDLVIAKKQWGAFYGTDLDLQLRRRGITQLVLAGISTSIGVETTARNAWEHGYHVTIARDAVTDLNAEAEQRSLDLILPRLAEVDDSTAIIALLPPRSG